MIACALCVGANPEPYLAATLASVAPFVDVLVVNDNSGLAENVNRSVVRASALGPRAHIFEHSFRGFDAMRNDAFADLASIAQPDWILFLDADEVHGEQISAIARTVLPKLPRSVGEVDGYTYHFWGTFDWISDIARRMMFYRFDPGLRWEHSVHEKLRGIPGKAIVLPYIYHHYGNVLPPSLLAAKYQRYFEFGNPVPPPPAPSEATIAMYVDKAAHVRPFRGAHPAAARDTITHLRSEYAADLAAIDEGLRAHRTGATRLRNGIAGANERARAMLRGIEHPGLYRGPLMAR
jgi:hypothetical protein